MVKIEIFVVGLLETNSYLVYDSEEKVGYLIDPGSFDKRIRKAIEENQVRVKNIINTHGHMDHTGGNRNFAYPVLIHGDDRDFIKDTKPARLLKDGDMIGDGELALEVIHTPGHTPGSISLLLGDKIFTGDTLFYEGVGRTDFAYGSASDIVRSIRERLFCLDDGVQVLPGHGPCSTIGHEKKNNPFVLK